AQLLLQQLDKPRAQVRITGYIYDVDLNEIEQLGVDWGQRVNSTTLDANGVPRNMGLGGSGLLSPSPISNSAQVLSGVVEETATATAGAAGAAATATGPAGGQFLFRTLSSSFELQALIQALEQTKGSRLLADPHVTVVDRHKASLGIVKEIPVQTLTQTQQGGAIGTTTFRDAGITLDVTPRIAADGTIEMEVSPTYSVLAGYQSGNPVIDTRRASTVVRVNHGQALVIGGLRSKTTVETIKGIPGLMNVKYLGALFRMHDTDVRESELLVFIMPEIVGYCGGLPREMHALDVQRQQLSRIQTAVDGPFMADCRDPHCPHHHERPRLHNGLQDVGLIGNHDVVFVQPRHPEMETILHSPEELIPAGQEVFSATVAPARPVSLPPPGSRAGAP
ncbi:MAG: type II and III secretion system protein, partial [Planctomycetales bacterium]|nr:type II and III secretion system protein [Planctomycetales bacterium]